MQKKALPKKKVSKAKRNVSKNLIYFISLLLLLSVLLVTSQLNQRQIINSNAQVTNCSVGDIGIDAEEQKMMNLINNYRKSKGVAPLPLNQTLTRIAVWTSTDMSNRNQLSHTDSRGRDIFTRRSECGYVDGGSENIGVSDDGSAQYTFDWWRNSSEGHNEVLLAPQSVIAGIARVGKYWTLETGQSGEEEDPGQGQAQPTPSYVPPRTVTVPVSVPNPNCLGSCPTGTAGSPHNPNDPNNPNKSQNPGTANPSNGNLPPGFENMPEEKKNAFILFLELIKLILGFMLAILKMG